LKLDFWNVNVFNLSRHHQLKPWALDLLKTHSTNPGRKFKKPAVVKSKKNILFLHGGPGLNSSPEKKLLTPGFSKRELHVHYWNEPSLLRPHEGPYLKDHPYTGWIRSAEKMLLAIAEETGPVHMIGHSFAVNPIMDLLSKHSNLVSKISLIAPGFDLHTCHRNIVQIAIKDYEEDTSIVADELRKLLTQTRYMFDPPMTEALKLALQDPKLLKHYWSRPEQMIASLETMQSSEMQPDFPAFFEVLTEMSVRIRAGIHYPKNLKIPVQVAFGSADPVVLRNAEEPTVLDIFPTAEIKIFENCSHYLHLDEPEKFIEWVEAFNKEK